MPNMLSREEKIEAIVKSMETWGQDALITWAQDQMRQLLEHSPDEAIDTDYDQLTE